jgi:hypothetical protein
LINVGGRTGIKVQSIETPPVFRCPTDRDGEDNRWTQGNTVNNINSSPVSMINYVGSEGYSWWKTSVLTSAWWNTAPRNYLVPPPDADYRGVFAPENSTTMNEIKDGTSNTIVLAEANATGFGPKNPNLPNLQVAWTTNTGLPRIKGANAVFRSAWVFTQYAGEIQQAWYSMPDGTATNGLGNPQWFLQSPFSFTPTYVTAYGPNSDWPGPSSFHVGIVMVARADGSVGPQSTTISYPTWVFLNGIQDSKTFAEDQ